MIPYDPERVRSNVHQATTEELLDRVTVYREGMEPQALDMIEAELAGRGFKQAEIEAHVHRRLEEGVEVGAAPPRRCSFCNQPAVETRWGWGRFRLFKLIPVPLPGLYRYCPEHRRRSPPTSLPRADAPRPPA